MTESQRDVHGGEGQQPPVAGGVPGRVPDASAAEGREDARAGSEASATSVAGSRATGGPASGHSLPDDGRVTDRHTLAGVPDAFSRLWNAHRMAYVSKGQEQVKDEHTCPFCAAPSRSDEDSLILHRGETCFVLLNLYPYNPGHLLICPYRHVPMYTDITAEETAEMARLTQTAMVALERVAAPAGYNLGMNQGMVGGAGIAAHLHQHVVPRWSGDGNFLPIIAQTKNMAQTLGQTWQLLHDAWDEAADEFARRQGRSSTTADAPTAPDAAPTADSTADPAAGSATDQTAAPTADQTAATSSDGAAPEASGREGNA